MTQENKIFWERLIRTMVVLAVTFAFTEVCLHFDKVQYLWQGETNIVSSDLIALTNESRKAISLKELQISPVLTKTAQKIAEDMAKKGYFAHTSPEGKKFTTWLKEAGYDYLYAGENLAVRFNMSKAVAEAWLKSPSHRANLLSSRYQEIGIGLAEGVYKNQKTVFVVQLFGTTKLPNYLSRN